MNTITVNTKEIKFPNEKQLAKAKVLVNKWLKLKGLHIRKVESVKEYLSWIIFEWTPSWATKNDVIQLKYSYEFDAFPRMTPAWVISSFIEEMDKGGVNMKGGTLEYRH